MQSLYICLQSGELVTISKTSPNLKEKLSERITVKAAVKCFIVAFAVLFAALALVTVISVFTTDGNVDNWRIVVALSVDCLLLALAGAVLIDVVVIISVSSYRKRITAYSVAIQNMADGKIGDKLEITENDEISKLGVAFNDVSEKYAIIERQRTEFVSNASHELKTPLSSIKLMADSIIQTPEIEMDFVREFLTDMNEEVERLNRIVNKLLYITKLDTLTENMSGTLELINLKDVVIGINKSLIPIAEMENKELVLTADDDILIMANKDILWQAVYNIVDNALKYTKEQGRVELSLIKESKRAIITVKDDGVGISEEDVGRIFDRFYRVDKARSRETGGTGLGLSIAHSAIEFHNGSIEVSSRLGEGSTFTIVLPLVDWL